MPTLPGRCLFLELGQNALRLLKGDQGLDVPLERLENGRLTSSCKEKLASALRLFSKGQTWGLRQRAWCAISARGVSIRQLTLPAAAKEELQRLLALQMEREFPVPPEELAWGACLRSVTAGTPGQGQGWVIAALKRDVLREYSDILSSCGLAPIFTLSALARNAVCAAPPASYALLDIGQHQSELTSFENGTITAARILPWGGENVTQAIAVAFALSPEEAERLKLRFGQDAGSMGEVSQKIEACVQSAVETLVSLIDQRPAGWKLYVSGATSRLSTFLSAVRKGLGGLVECDSIESEVGPGRSAATLGLRRLFNANAAAPQLVLRLPQAKRVERSPQPAAWMWPAVACVLLVASLGLRYGEPFLFKSRLAKRLGELAGYRAGAPRIDRELGFLEYLETNQPPFLDALLTIAKAAPGGTRFDSVAMTRRGDVSMKGMMANAQQATDLRSKLIESGFFETVVLDEQSPTPDRQRVVVRFTAQWKPNGQRPAVAADPLPNPPSQSGPPPRLGKGVPLAPGNSPGGELIRGNGPKPPSSAPQP